MHKSLAVSLFLGLLACAALPGPAAAEELDGDAILALMDKAHTQAKDQFFVFDVVTEEAGKAARSLRFQVTLNNKSWRMVHFLDPGDVKDMRVLTMDTSRIWLWLPAFKKVRKMASHAKAQGFMGTALSSEDTSMVTYGDLFQGKLLSQDDKIWTVEGTRREGADVAYAKIVFEIRKDIKMPPALHYFNDKGVEVKTETRTSYECKDGLCNPRVMTMIDHTRGDIKSTMVRRDWKYNQGVDDSFFTVRALQRG
ncbi:MAG TPA: outer membrane lipoprotein-sorting protein [Myxococcota bacterium]|nr:outer membrane lipoprotein-sorting protein [Myxococcota bacterium]HRY93088.1 outer membrane lipoprotein-sorting protein [Myxococcota bacterium]HSA20093.1 outer membrane lipoprotein-sorting protein [Myxococcota bacterium]